MKANSFNELIMSKRNALLSQMQKLDFIDPKDLLDFNLKIEILNENLKNEKLKADIDLILAKKELLLSKKEVFSFNLKAKHRKNHLKQRYSTQLLKKERDTLDMLIINIKDIDSFNIKKQTDIVSKINMARF